MNKQVFGKKIAEEIKEELRQKIVVMERKPVFSIVYVGQDKVIDNFIRYKQKFGEAIGVEVIVHRFPQEITEEQLIEEVFNIFSNKKNDAVIVQLPLPKHIEAQAVLDTLPVAMDVDVLGTSAKELFHSGDSPMVAPVTGAMIEILKRRNFSLTDKNIVIFGYGNLVGKPFGLWLDAQNIPYEVIDRNTDEVEKRKLLKNAELIVSGVGVPHILKPDMISENVVLLDGGTSEAGKKIRGDVDPACYEKALFYTPVPGGIGPLTIAILYRNVLESTKYKLE